MSIDMPLNYWYTVDSTLYACTKECSIMKRCLSLLKYQKQCNFIKVLFSLSEPLSLPWAAN